MTQRLSKPSQIHRIHQLFGIDPTKRVVVENGFWVLSGIFAGIGLNDVWRFFNLPGEDQPVYIDGKSISYDMDYFYQLAIATGVIALDVVFNMKHFQSLGAGMILGSTFANRSEGSQATGKDHSKYIGFVK